MDWCIVIYSGGSRISRRGGIDLIGRVLIPEAVTLRKFCMSKQKNLDPLGGACAPRSATDLQCLAGLYDQAKHILGYDLPGGYELTVTVDSGFLIRGCPTHLHPFRYPRVTRMMKIVCLNEETLARRGGGAGGVPGNRYPQEINRKGIIILVIRPGKGVVCVST